MGSGASPVPSIVRECTAQSMVNWPLLWVPATAFEVLSAQKTMQDGFLSSLSWERGVLHSVLLLFCPTAGGTWFPRASQVEVISIIPTLENGKLKQKTLR